MVFPILMGINLIAAAIVVVFYLIGLADGTVSAFNAGIWAMALLGCVAIPGGSYALHSAGWHKSANMLLLVIAVPAALFGLFFALVIGSGERWN